MIKETFEFKNITYPAIVLENFDTSSGFYIDSAVFTSEDFLNADDHTFLYQIIKDKMFCCLPKKLIENGTESEIRKYILENVY